MSSHTPFDGSKELDRARRRKFQNRMAQRKHRERIKAQRRNSFCDRKVANAITDNSGDNALQNISFRTLDQVLQDLSIPGSTNECQDESSRQQIESFTSVFSPGQESQEGQTLDDQFTMLDRAERDDNFEIDGQFLSSPDELLQGHQTCESYMDNGSKDFSLEQTNHQRETAALIQSQRARICDQAERLLEKIISLYDFGVSLDILVADPNLRILIAEASKNFNTQRSVGSHVADRLTLGKKPMGRILIL